MNVLLRELSWPQIEKLANESTVVILPTAAIEQHGRHLPIDVDCATVETVAIRSAERVRNEFPVLVAPTVSFGVSGYHMGFAGSMTLSIETFLAVVQEVCISLIHHGFRRILILNGHGGNDEPLRIATRNIADLTGVAVAAASYWTIAAKELAPFQGREVDYIPGHACGFETACMLAIRPDLVDEEAMHAATEVATEVKQNTPKNAIAMQDVKSLLPKQSSGWGDHGWRGDPTRSSQAKGEKYLEIIEKQVAEFLRAFVHSESYWAYSGFRHDRVQVLRTLNE